jgi:hypothetical protein
LFAVKRKPGPAIMYMYVGNRQGGFEMVLHDCMLLFDYPFVPGWLSS